MCLRCVGENPTLQKKSSLTTNLTFYNNNKKPTQVSERKVAVNTFRPFFHKTAAAFSLSTYEKKNFFFLNVHIFFYKKKISTKYYYSTLTAPLQEVLPEIWCAENFYQ